MLPVDWGEGWPNVCLMTSVEDQLRISRIEHLIATPAKYRALSVEPLLAPVKLKPSWLGKIDWIIVGGESGGSARLMHPQWVRDLRDQCAKSGVKFFFKQWGCWTPDESFGRKNLGNAAHFADAAGAKPTLLAKMSSKARREFQAATRGGTWVYRTTKGKAGNPLDGHRHREHPFEKRISPSAIIVALNSDEQTRLKKCEAAIRAGLGTFVEVGTALMEIRDARLYRGMHATFEDYVNSVLSLSRTYAYNIMDSAQVVRDLSSIEDIPRLPTNEAQARELARIKTPEERVDAWRKVVAVAGDEPLTAQKMRAIIHPPTSVGADSPTNRARKIGAMIAGLRRLFAEAGASVDAERLLKQLEALASE